MLTNPPANLRSCGFTDQPSRKLREGRSDIHRSGGFTRGGPTAHTPDRSRSSNGAPPLGKGCCRCVDRALGVCEATHSALPGDSLGRSSPTLPDADAGRVGQNRTTSILREGRRGNRRSGDFSRGGPTAHRTTHPCAPGSRNGDRLLRREMRHDHERGTPPPRERGERTRVGRIEQALTLRKLRSQPDGILRQCDGNFRSCVCAVPAMHCDLRPTVNNGGQVWGWCDLRYVKSANRR